MKKEIQNVLLMLDVHGGDTRMLAYQHPAHVLVGIVIGTGTKGKPLQMGPWDVQHIPGAVRWLTNGLRITEQRKRAMEESITRMLPELRVILGVQYDLQ